MNYLKDAQFRATAAGRQAFGATRQEALNSLMRLLPRDSGDPIVIWPCNRGDGYFTEAQIERLRELMNRQPALSRDEREELKQLIDAEIGATVARSRALWV